MRLYTPSYWKVMDATGNRACNWQTVPGDTLGIGNGDVRTNDFWHYWMWNEAGYTWQNTPDMRRAPNNWIEMGKETAEIITVRPGSPNLGEPLSRQYYKSLADTVDTWYPWPQYKTYTPLIITNRMADRVTGIHSVLPKLIFSGQKPISGKDNTILPR